MDTNTDTGTDDANARPIMRANGGGNLYEDVRNVFPQEVPRPYTPGQMIFDTIAANPLLTNAEKISKLHDLCVSYFQIIRATDEVVARLTSCLLQEKLSNLGNDLLFPQSRPEERE